MTYAALPTAVEIERRLAELAGFPAWLRVTLASAPEPLLRARPGPAPADFSPHEHAWHLRDIEVLGYERRIAAILEREHPRLPDLDGTRLAIEGRYLERPLAPALDELARSRARSLARLAALDACAFARTGEMEGRGSVTLAELVDAWLGHDRGHRDELAALLGARLSSV